MEVSFLALSDAGAVGTTNRPNIIQTLILLIRGSINHLNEAFVISDPRKGCQVSMLRLAAPFASLFLFSGFAVGGIYAPDCSTSWSWVRMLLSFLSPELCSYCAQSFNSLGQNACTVAAYLMSTCNGGCELFFLTLICPVLSSSSNMSHLFLSIHYQFAGSGIPLHWAKRR